MDKASTFTIGFLFLAHFSSFGNAIFEFICDEKQLYRPYIHVYRERKGMRVLDLGPGFHKLADYKNVYVCINGIVYLYFSKNTELGEVYEAPQLKKYAHVCEMYNVQPREGSASIVEVQLQLRAILLLGDPVDYRRASIQKFTAPYYFRKDQLNPHLPNETEYSQMPALYINASSMVIIGQSECTLSKGNGKNALIKVRPHVFETSSNGTEGYLCKIGFQPLLDKASNPQNGTVPSDEDRAPALAMINDEAIRVEKCVTSPLFDAGEAPQSYNSINEEIENIKNDYVDKKDDHLEKYNTLVDATVTPMKTEKEKLEAKKTDNSTKQRDLKKLEKQLSKLESRIKTEEDKKTRFANAIEAISKELTEINTIREDAKPDGTKANAAKTDREKVEKAKSELDSVRNQKPAQQTEIDTKKQAYDEARKTAKESARQFLWATSELEVRHMKLKKLVDKVERLSTYTPSSGYNNKGKRTSSLTSPEGTMSVIISAKEGDCEKLPVLEGEDGECAKGKPDKNDSCNMFQTTLGILDPWSQKIEPPRNDSWKKEILQLVGDIFMTACDRIRNVKKFVKLNNRVMTYYLTNEKIFNLKPNLTTDTCVNFKFSKTLRMLDGSQPSQLANLTYMEEKKFWSTIKYVLHECKMQGRRLRFKENKTGAIKFLKSYGAESEEEVDVLFHREQADMEYSYNWCIDMNWKMFVTVMGLCMPTYEKTIPLITSRFFSSYTEYFLIPLRETWINQKDNVIFQFIMGEFYNSHTEYWADMCMEASFIYAGQRDYRPPRSLMVNCASEHNYLLNGEFSKGGKT